MKMETKQGEKSICRVRQSFATRLPGMTVPSKRIAFLAANGWRPWPLCLWTQPLCRGSGELVPWMKTLVPSAGWTVLSAIGRSATSSNSGQTLLDVSSRIKALKQFLRCFAENEIRGLFQRQGNIHVPRSANEYMLYSFTRYFVHKPLNIKSKNFGIMNSTWLSLSRDSFHRLASSFGFCTSEKDKSHSVSASTASSTPTFEPVWNCTP